MTVDDGVRLALVLLIIGCAGLVKGAIGFGFPLIGVPLIASVLDARSAVVIVSLASLLGNVGITLRGGGNPATFWRLAPLLAGLVVGTIAGALLLASLDAALLSRIVGGCAVLFAAISALKPGLAVPSHLERFLALPTGLLGGVLGGSTSIFGPAVASYVHALHLGKRDFVFYISLLYLVGGAVQVTSYARLGLYDAHLLLLVLVSCLPNAAGLWLGVRLQDRIDPALFRRLVVLVILASGLNLMLR